MEWSTNRFSDADDQPTDGTDVLQLMASCQKWSLKNDLELLTHLKQFSNDFMCKSETTNQSINDLVFEAKMNAVKVDNVINEMQMLANSQFVENRVYDEEMDDIMANEAMNAIEMVATKPKEEDILPKIKSALNIGLHFLDERFDCVSKQMSQNDSDDENDQIVEGLISDTTRSEYSQRLLPYIIGSEDFINDHFVGLSRADDTPTVDHMNKPENDSLSVDSDMEAIDIRNTIPDKNVFNDYLSDSDDNSVDIFGSLPPKTQIVSNSDKHESSDESDFETFKTEAKSDNLIGHKDDVVSDPKPVITSFQDELSAAISAKNPYKQSTKTNEDQSSVTEDEPNSELFSNEKPIQTPISLESDSSDESDSIFKVNKSKSKSQTKQKSNFDDLFGNQTNDSSVFGRKPDKPKLIARNINKVLPPVVTNRVATNNSSLLTEEDDEDGDDLFGSLSQKKATIEPIVKKEINSHLNDKKNLVTNKKPVIEKRSLFSDDDSVGDDIDDLFIGSIDNKPIESNAEENDNIFNKVSDKQIGKSFVDKKSLFSDEDEEGDDLFSGAVSKKIVSSVNKDDNSPDFSQQNNVIKTDNQLNDKTPLFNDEDIDELFISDNNRKFESIGSERENPSLFSNRIGLTKERTVVEKKSLFSDDDSDEDANDLFSAIHNKKKVESTKETKTNSFDKSVTNNEKPVIAKRTHISLFGDQHNYSQNNEEEDMDDMFRSVNNQSDTQIDNKKSDLSNMFDSNNIVKSDNKINDKKASIFSDEDNDEEVDDLFVGGFDKHSIEPIVNESKNPNHNCVNKSEKPVIDRKPLFSDDDNDDLFIAADHKKPINESTIKTEKADICAQNNVKTIDNSFVKKSLFDDEDDDDLFNTSIKQSIDSSVRKDKTNSNVFEKNIVKNIDKKKSLFDGDSDEEDADHLFSVAISKTTTISPVVIKESKSVEPTADKIVNSKAMIKNEKRVVDIKSVFDDEDDDDLFGSAATIKTKTSIKPIVTKQEVAVDDSPAILANDVLKHKAILGSQRSRRPPSKRLSKKPND